MVENSLGREENAWVQVPSPFPTSLSNDLISFSGLLKTWVVGNRVNSSFENAFNMNKSIILSSGEGLSRQS